MFLTDEIKVQGEFHTPEDGMENAGWILKPHFQTYSKGKFCKIVTVPAKTFNFDKNWFYAVSHWWDFSTFFLGSIMVTLQCCPFTKPSHTNGTWLKNKPSKASQMELQYSSADRLSFSVTLWNQFPFTGDNERSHELYKRKVVERSRRGRTDSGRTGNKRSAIASVNVSRRNELT